MRGGCLPCPSPPPGPPSSTPPWTAWTFPPSLVWDALREIPYGTTATYGEIAARIGRPGAARAVGSANHHNPLSIFVPCHRVLGANGALTGYAGGLEAKRKLLAIEGVRLSL